MSESRNRGLVRNIWLRLRPLAALITIVVAVTFLGSTGSRLVARTTVNALILLVLVVGLYIFWGLTGVMSFGHMGLAAVGGYSSALLTMSPETKSVLLPDLPSFIANVQLGFVPALIVAGLFTSFIALVISVPILRMEGLSATIGTFAFLMITNTVARNWEAVTGGTGAMVGVSLLTTRNAALGWAIVAIIAAYLFQTSRVGLRLRASRDDALAAGAAGINVERERRRAFVLSAFFTGVGGGLWGHFLGVFGPDVFFFVTTFLVIVMLVVGGVRSLSGAVIGTVVISVVLEIFRQLESGAEIGPFEITLRAGVREMSLSIIMLLVLAFLPDGLTKGRELFETSAARASHWVNRPSGSQAA